jgi:hypothetical protein
LLLEVSSFLASFFVHGLNPRSSFRYALFVSAIFTAVHLARLIPVTEANLLGWLLLIVVTATGFIIGALAQHHTPLRSLLKIK